MRSLYFFHHVLTHSWHVKKFVSYVDSTRIRIKHELLNPFSSWCWLLWGFGIVVQWIQWYLRRRALQGDVEGRCENCVFSSINTYYVPTYGGEKHTLRCKPTVVACSLREKGKHFFNPYVTEEYHTVSMQFVDTVDSSLSSTSTGFHLAGFFINW